MDIPGRRIRKDFVGEQRGWWGGNRRYHVGEVKERIWEGGMTGIGLWFVDWSENTVHYTLPVFHKSNPTVDTIVLMSTAFI